MSKPHPTVSIDVPADLEEQIALMIAGLQASAIKSDQSDQSDPQMEISGIAGHHVTPRGDFVWHIKFKDGVTADVDDADVTDPQCLETISAYLQAARIQTAYVWIRVSSKLQANQDTVSLQAQEDYIRGYLRDSGFTGRIKVISLVRSGYSKTAPRVLESIANSCNMGDQLVGYSVDRLARNLSTYYPIYDMIDSTGVQDLLCKRGS